MSECYQQTAPVLAASTIIDEVTNGDRPEGIGLHESVAVAATGGGVNGIGERPVKVVVLGEEGVGKTALLQQFMTSDYMAAVQTNFGLYDTIVTFGYLTLFKRSKLNLDFVCVQRR
jgi:hypothetical protein